MRRSAALIAALLALVRPGDAQSCPSLHHFPFPSKQFHLAGRACAFGAPGERPPVFSVRADRVSPGDSCLVPPFVNDKEGRCGQATSWRGCG